jgi:hypothetical protein
LAGASHGAKIAMAAKSMSSTKPAAASGWRRNLTYALRATGAELGASTAIEVSQDLNVPVAVTKCLRNEMLTIVTLDFSDTQPDNEITQIPAVLIQSICSFVNALPGCSVQIVEIE